MIFEYETRNHRDMHIPKARLEYGKRGFYFYGSKILNEFPDDIREQESLTRFKNILESAFWIFKAQTRPLGRVASFIISIVVVFVLKGFVLNKILNGIKYFK